MKSRSTGPIVLASYLVGLPEGHPNMLLLEACRRQSWCSLKQTLWSVTERLIIVHAASLLKYFFI